MRLRTGGASTTALRVNARMSERLEITAATKAALEVGEWRMRLAWLRDLAALGKPRLSALVLFTTAGGLWLAPGEIGLGRAIVTLLMTTLAVASANTLNCYLERQTDGLMKRTRGRPLPGGRISPTTALVVGVLSALVSVPVLTFYVNPLAGALAALAILSYVAVYTPMKYVSPHAVTVGCLPGAIPPLLGWTAVTNRMDPGGLALFAVLFVWQLPHFLAIAVYLKEDYRKAGIRVVPLVQGDRAAAGWTIATAVLLVPVSLVLVPLGVANWGYGLAALALGVWFVARTLKGLSRGVTPKWARQVMLASVLYLTLLFVALGVGAV